MWAVAVPLPTQLATTPTSCNISFVEHPRWLLLGHQLPTRSSNARVKTWRRLQQIGAVPARNSVYVLPNTEQCREDFEWIRSEIVALGGEATVFAADAISAGGTEDIVAVFQRTREQEFRRLKRDIDRLLPPGTGQRPRSGAKGRMNGRTARVLRERLIGAGADRLLPHGCPCGDGARHSSRWRRRCKHPHRSLQRTESPLDAARFPESSLGDAAATWR